MKRALVLSGGGSKGAYQVGAVDYLVNEKNLTFDIVCGSSVGSINAVYLSQFSTHEEKDGIKALKKMWENLKRKNVYKQWFPFGWFQFWKKGLYNLSPLKKFLLTILDFDKIKKSNRQLSVGAVSISSGEYKVVNKNDENLIDMVVGSCSIPLLFPPHKFGNDYYCDAGVRENVPLQQAVKLGADEIYIISTDPSVLDKANVENLKIGHLTFRIIEIMLAETIKNDLVKIERINQEVSSGVRADKRIIKCFVIQPSFTLVENSVNFNHDEIIKMIEIGFEDAKKTMND